MSETNSKYSKDELPHETINLNKIMRIIYYPKLMRIIEKDYVHGRNNTKFETKKKI